VVTNTTHRLCPWATVLFAMDVKWWSHYHEEAAAFAGKKIGWSPIVTKYGAESMQGKMTGFGNSGTDAICYAMREGATDIVMLGYDVSITTKVHWHGNHPKGLSNASSVGNWPEKFKLLAKHCQRQGVRVVNASRQTSLRCFERVKLEDVL
jgi:hypothetical protein